MATYCTEVARAAHRQGWPLQVWVPGKPQQDPEQVSRLGGGLSLQWPDLAHFTVEILRRRREWFGQRVFLASLGSHWIFAHLWRMGLTGSTRMVPLFHGSEILRYERSFWFRSLVPSWLSACHGVMAASPYTRERVASSPLLPVGRAIGLADCAVRQDLRDQAEGWPQSENDSGPGRSRILTLARIHPRKGQLEVIQALALLPELWRKKVVYQVAGTGDSSYRQELEDQARQRGVAVEFSGAVSDDQLGATYAASDLYVMTSRSLPRSVEGFGMTYLEAGLFGKPVIGYRTGGVAGAVTDGETGLLVEEGNVDQLARALLTLLEDPVRARTMGQCGRRRALGMTWDRTVQALRDQ